MKSKRGKRVQQNNMGGGRVEKCHESVKNHLNAPYMVFPGRSFCHVEAESDWSACSDATGFNIHCKQKYTVLL